MISAGVTGAELIAHSMPIPPSPGSAGGSGIAAYSEEEFLAGGRQEIRDRAGSHWWSTMRLAGREALHRSAVHLTRGAAPHPA